LHLLCFVRKCISICILVTILVSQYGHYCFYAMEEIQLRSEFNNRMASNLPLSSLEKIEESDQITWKEDGKEFFLDGELFDIVKTEKVGAKSFYYVLNDKAEKELDTEFNKILKSHQNDTKNSRLDLKILLAVFTLQSEPAIVFGIDANGITYFNRDSGVINLPRNIIPNPPRFITA